MGLFLRKNELDKKNVLLLGCKDSLLFDWMVNKENLIQTMERIDLNYLLCNKIDFVISYKYRHILSKDIIDKYYWKIINLHISYLPWNRGSDPNIWSFIDNTPKGVSIHYMDYGIDTGDIIKQKIVYFDSSIDTLRSFYNKLNTEIQLLFIDKWHDIKNFKCDRTKQGNYGTYHETKEKFLFEKYLIHGWDTLISDIEKGLKEKKIDFK